jgi:hypothetical protein
MEKPLPTEGDHSDMAKLCHRGDSVYTSIVSHLKRFSRSDKDMSKGERPENVTSAEPTNRT